MKSIIAAATVALSLLAPFTTAQDEERVKDLSDLKMNQPTKLGCYKFPGNYLDFGNYRFQALGYCQPLCVRQGIQYLAFVNGTNCLCGDSAPSASDKVEDSKCMDKCRGYDQDFCGGENYFAVYDDGYKEGDATGNLKITMPRKTITRIGPAPSTTNAAGQTVYVTQSGVTEPTTIVTTEPAASGPNKAAIAAGVVVGIVVLAGIVGGIIFFIRQKKRKALEEERRRHETMSNFVNKGEKPPSTYSLADSRLEPSVMFQRRQSDGSIADNQDYSRRILKVTNPDG